MKRYQLALAVVCAALALAACGGEQSAREAEPLFSRPFRMTAECASNAAEYSFSFEYHGVQNGLVRFISPAAVCGMTLERDGAAVREEFLGRASESEFDSLPRANPLAALFAFAAREREGGVIHDGERRELPDGSTALTASGVPLEMRLAGAGLDLKITSFEYLD